MNSKIDIRLVFSQNLKYYRKQANLTQSQLAEMCDITDKYVSDLERQLYFPSLELIDTIAAALNIPAYLLLKYDEEHNKDI